MAKKKKYSRPSVKVETFQIDTAVASCSGEGGVALHYSYETCTALEETGDVWFGNACAAPAYSDPGKKVCYNAPLFDVTFMNS